MKGRPWAPQPKIYSIQSSSAGSYFKGGTILLVQYQPKQSQHAGKLKFANTMAWPLTAHNF